MSEAKAQIRSGQRSDAELEAGPMPGPGFLRKLPHKEARRRRLESNKRREERHISAGKCRKCSKPLCRESVDYCEKRLAMRRKAQRRRRGTVHAHGRHPNTLKAFRAASEKRKRGKPTVIHAAKEALARPHAQQRPCNDSGAAICGSHSSLKTDGDKGHKQIAF